MSSTISAPITNVNVREPVLQNSSSALIRNTFEYYYNPDNSSLLKICSAVLIAFATLTAGYLFGQTLLMCSVVASMVVLVTSMETERVQNEETIQAQEREIAYLEVLGMLGGVLNMAEMFEELDLGDREFATGAIDLQLNEVSTLTRGEDKYGRRFFALPLERRGDGTRHLIVLYEKYISGNIWSVIGPQDLIQDPLTDEGKVALGLLIVGEHESYRCNNHPNGSHQADEERVFSSRVIG